MPSYQLISRASQLLCGVVYWLGLLVFVVGLPTQADIINPALAEISIKSDNSVQLELSFNAEAILSDSSLYQNSKNSPNSDYYDELRASPPEQIEQLFKQRLKVFLTQLSLVFDKQNAQLSLVSFFVPDIGYQGRPRVSKLIISTRLKQAPNTLLWQYPKQYGDSAYRYEFYQKEQYNWSSWQWVRANQSPKIIELNNANPPNTWSIFKQYSTIGFLHIMPKGLDHILFMLGIALLALSWRKLLLLVSIFTLAHSATLALAVYGLINIPASIVEPLIALSIAYIGFEVLRQHSPINPKQNASQQTYLLRRSVLVFGFGLLHGLGFAVVLNSFDLQTTSLALSLLGFNIGVELAQAGIVLFVLLLLWLGRYQQNNLKRYFIKPIAILISLVGLVWTIERLIV